MFRANSVFVIRKWNCISTELLKTCRGL